MESTSKPKEIGKIKLNQLGKSELEKREMSALKGGEYEACFGKCGNYPGGVVYGYYGY